MSILYRMSPAGKIVNNETHHSSEEIGYVDARARLLSIRRLRGAVRQLNVPYLLPALLHLVQLLPSRLDRQPVRHAGRREGQRREERNRARHPPRLHHLNREQRAQHPAQPGHRVTHTHRRRSHRRVDRLRRVDVQHGERPHASSPGQKQRQRLEPDWKTRVPEKHQEGHHVERHGRGERVPSAHDVHGQRREHQARELRRGRHENVPVGAVVKVGGIVRGARHLVRSAPAPALPPVVPRRARVHVNLRREQHHSVVRERHGEEYEPEHEGLLPLPSFEQPSDSLKRLTRRPREPLAPARALVPRHRHSDGTHERTLGQRLRPARPPVGPGHPRERRLRRG